MILLLPLFAYFLHYDSVKHIVCVCARAVCGLPPGEENTMSSADSLKRQGKLSPLPKRKTIRRKGRKKKSWVYNTHLSFLLSLSLSLRQGYYALIQANGHHGFLNHRTSSSSPFSLKGGGERERESLATGPRELFDNRERDSFCYSSLQTLLPRSFSPHSIITSLSGVTKSERVGRCVISSLSSWKQS